MFTKHPQFWILLYLQEQACLWLGRWYQEVGVDLEKAKACFEEALVLNPKDVEVAKALRKVNHELGKTAEAEELAHLTDAAPATASSEPKSAFAAASLPPFADQIQKGLFSLLILCCGPDRCLPGSDPRDHPPVVGMLGK